MTAKRLLALLTAATVGVTGLWTTPAAAAGMHPEHTATAIRKATNGLHSPVRGASSPEMAFTGTVGDTHISMARAPHMPVAVTSASGRIGIHLPSHGQQHTVTTTDGTLVRQGEHYSTAVQALPDGSVRALIVAADVQAPHAYRFPIALPDGGRLARLSEVMDVPADTDAGDVFVVDAAGNLVGGFRPPWATDAAGAPVPTRYRIEGSTLVQQVDFTATTAFPVVADPWWNPIPNLRCNRARAAWYAYTALGMAVCGGIGVASGGWGIPLSVVCNAVRSSGGKNIDWNQVC